MSSFKKQFKKQSLKTIAKQWKVYSSLTGKKN